VCILSLHSYKAQEIEDRKRIHQLISRDPGSGSSAHPPGGLQGYSTDVLLLKVESLQAQLNEQVRFHDGALKR